MAVTVGKQITNETAEIQNDRLSDMAAQSVKANATNGVSSPSDLAVAENSILGRGTGDLRSLALGTNLSITSGTLNAIGGGSDTAAEILAKLVTVDGAGSGLDADMLDGLNATDLATAAQGALAASASQPGHTHAQSDVTGLAGALSGKQDTLVSGTNIKTVNGLSLLGSGDLLVSGGGGGGGASPIISWAI